MKIILTIAVFLVLSLPSPGGATTGGELYRRYCSSCHGLSGEGAKAPALNKEGLLVTVDKDYIKKTIFHGRPFLGCPSFKRVISEAEMDEIASQIKSWQKGPMLAAPRHDVAPRKTARGEEIFILCGGCHGLEGEGAMAPPLLDPGFLESVSDVDLRRTIMWGRPGTPMKGYMKGMGGMTVLTPEETDEVISYIRYRQKGLR